MAAEFRERRRFPRTLIHGRQEFRLGRRFRVRVVDISASGALLASDDALPVGGKGRLQILLGGSPFEAQIEVRREQPDAEGRGRLIGATVAPSQPRHRDALDQFLKRAGN